MKKGRIVQFADGQFAFQKLLLGFIPFSEYLLPASSDYTWHYNVEWCKHKTLESLRQLIKEIEKHKNSGKIVRVVKETELEKALE